ncbi:hypothetical protein GCM10007176_06480 [Salinicoccus roseus]|nr:hypothetical protein GCM10007176_06480 [Salinicoccus roseus]
MEAPAHSGGLDITNDLSSYLNRVDSGPESIRVVPRIFFAPIDDAPEFFIPTTKIGEGARKNGL